MTIELEYHSEDLRWYWRVYGEFGMVREGFARSLPEAENVSRLAALEYESRQVIEL